MKATIFAVTLSLTACAGANSISELHPQLKEIISTFDPNDDADTVESLRFDYDAENRLSEVHHLTSGEDGVWEYTHDENNVREINFRGWGERIEASFNVSEGLVTGGRSEGDGYYGRNFEITYTQDTTLRQVTEHYDASYQRTKVYDYDDEGRLLGEVFSFEAFDEDGPHRSEQSATYQYSDESENLEQMIKSHRGGIVDTDERINFRYDAEDRLEEIQDESSVYNIIYNDEGFVETIDVRRGGDEQRLEFLYNEQVSDETYVALPLPGRLASAVAQQIPSTPAN